MLEIRSGQNAQIKYAIELRCDGRARKKHKRILLVGDHSVFEQDSRPLALYSADPKDRPDYLLTPELMEKISGLAGYSGVVAEYSMPDAQLTEGQYLLVLDRISDPGNMGTLLRTAFALGWDGAWISPGSVDPFNDKALRASKGAVLKLPIYFGTLEALFETERLVFVADMEGRPRGTCTGSLALVLSNESRGVDWRRFPQVQVVGIPMQGRIESLNVASAGAILMYTMREIG